MNNLEKRDKLAKEIMSLILGHKEFERVFTNSKEFCEKHQMYKKHCEEWQEKDMLGNCE